MFMPTIRYRKDMKHLFKSKYSNKNNIITQKIRWGLKNASWYWSNLNKKNKTFFFIVGMQLVHKNHIKSCKGDSCVDKAEKKTQSTSKEIKKKVKKKKKVKQK